MSHAESGCALMGVIADNGWGVDGVSFRHLSCCAEGVMALLGASALAGVFKLAQGSAPPA
jgi:hypothetical protein